MVSKDYVPSGKLPYAWKITFLKRYITYINSQRAIFNSYVSLPEGKFVLSYYCTSELSNLGPNIIADQTLVRDLIEATNEDPEFAGWSEAEAWPPNRKNVKQVLALS